MQPSFLTYYPAETRNGCGHFCARDGRTTLCGAIALADLRDRWPGVQIVDVSGVPWRHIANAPDNPTAEYYLSRGGRNITKGGAQ